MHGKPTELVLADVGARISQIGQSGSSRFFLYMETEEGMQSPSLYQEFDDEVRSLNALGVDSLLYDLWLDTEPRWGALRIELNGEEFKATFDYDVDPTDGQTDERAQAAIKARFGDKPIAYQSLEEWTAQHHRQAAMFS